MNVSIIPAPKQIQMHKGFATSSDTEKRIVGEMSEEEYRVQITEKKIVLEGGSETALCYAKATLEQTKQQFPEKLPCMSVEDESAFSYRSFHIDCARHFFPIAQLKKMIGMAAYFKLNQFHWHFCDDQGWRIESKVFPRLHEIGALRKGDHFGNYSSEETEHFYYTQDEVKEIVEFCRERGIDVVPEMDIPGHVSAILAAYPQIGCTGEPVEVRTKPGIFREILCAGKEETYVFLETLIGELLELFPGTYFHIGGDETPKTSWSACPHCNKRMKNKGLENYQQLQGEFCNRIAAFLSRHGRKVICWSDAAYGGNLDPSVILQYWTEDKTGQVREHTKKGGKVILSPMMNAYCDYPHAFISTKAVHDLDTMPTDLPVENILGTECLVWTEYIRDNNWLESRAWPRFCASAEAGWCGVDKPDYEDFCRRLKVLFPAFAAHGICATDEEGWSPSMEEGIVELMIFKSNFTDAIKEEYTKMQEEI